MNAQEVIDIMKIAIAEVEWNYPLDYAIAFEEAIKALEKQIPKKPIPNSHDMFGIKCCICPVCSCHVYSTSNNFCQRCGQALDWSDTK